MIAGDFSVLKGDGPAESRRPGTGKEFSSTPSLAMYTRRGSVSLDVDSVMAGKTRRLLGK